MRDDGQQIFAQQRTRFAGGKFGAIARPISGSCAEAAVLPVVHQSGVDRRLAEGLCRNRVVQEDVKFVVGGDAALRRGWIMSVAESQRTRRIRSCWLGS